MGKRLEHPLRFAKPLVTLIEAIRYLRNFVVDCFVASGNTLKIMTFAQELKKWRGSKSLKQVAAILDLDYPSIRRYACGKRTPSKLAMEAIRARMEIRKDQIGE